MEIIPEVVDAESIDQILDLVATDGRRDKIAGQWAAYAANENRREEPPTREALINHLEYLNTCASFDFDAALEEGIKMLELLDDDAS